MKIRDKREMQRLRGLFYLPRGSEEEMIELARREKAIKNKSIIVLLTLVIILFSISIYGLCS